MNKPALLDSQNSKESRGSVVDWLREKYGYPGLVHRLDFGTSGLMVGAKDAATAAELTRELMRGDIKRVYVAIALGQIFPDEGHWDSTLDGQTALTRYRVLERFVNATLLELELETGRKHQIRKHASDNNHPLLGDHLYGKKGAKLLFNRPALHATRLTVRGKTHEAAPPADFEELRDRLRKAKRS